MIDHRSSRLASSFQDVHSPKTRLYSVCQFDVEEKNYDIIMIISSSSTVTPKREKSLYSGQVSANTCL